MNPINIYINLKVTVKYLLLIFLIINLNVLPYINATTDFCNKELCKLYINNEYQYVPHTGCNNTNEFSTSCPADRYLVALTEQNKKDIVDWHNNYRNEIATGQIIGFEPAKRMPMMRWDNELAYLAELNAKTCVFAHDKCRNTDNYPYSGQNLYMMGAYPNEVDINVAIKNMAASWFNEYTNCNMDYINSYRNHDQGKVIGHFTAMVNDKNFALGCAVVRYSRVDVNNVQWKYIHISCNYAFTNFINQPVYKSGASCSNCMTGCDANYKGLCNINENVNPLPDL